jgi:hypothetical protein
MGTIVVLVAIWALAQPTATAAEWTQAIAGVLLAFAPPALSYTDLTGAAWNAYVVCALIAVLALSALPAANRIGRKPASIPINERV